MHPSARSDDARTYPHLMSASLELEPVEHVVESAWCISRRWKVEGGRGAALLRRVLARQCPD